MAFELFLTRFERDRMLAFPEEISHEDLAQFFLLTDEDHRLVRRQRGDVSRLGFALTLCAVRFLGFVPLVRSAPPLVIEFVASQLGCASIVDGYAERAMTRSAHTRRVLEYLGYRRATDEDLDALGQRLAKRAELHSRPSVLLHLACQRLYDLRIIRPGPTRLERLVSAARQEAERRTYGSLSPIIRRSRPMLKGLLDVDTALGATRLTWLRERERRNSSLAICRTLDRHQWLLEHEVGSWSLEGMIHRNRCKYLARIGRSASVQMLQRMPDQRKFPVLIASLEQLLLDITDELIDMLQRQVLEFWAKAREAKQEFEAKRVSTRDEIVVSFAKVVGVLLNSRVAPEDIREKVYSRIRRAELRRLSAAVGKDARALDPSGLDFITGSYRSLRAFAARFLEQLPMHADPDISPDPPLLTAVRALRTANDSGQRSLPSDVTTEFISKAWLRYVAKGKGSRRRIDRKHYELATFCGLGGALRSGAIWVENSRRHASPGSYLMPRDRWQASRESVIAQLGAEADVHRALEAKVASLTALAADVEAAVENGAIREQASSSGERFAIPALRKTPDEESVEQLQAEVTRRMPSVELPSLLVEVDRWTDFSQRIPHPNDGRPPRGDTLVHLYGAILAQACNLGFSGVARSSNMTAEQIAWASRWFLHGDTLRPAFAALVDFQAESPLGRAWGPGTLSSSDGQRFLVAGHIREARAQPPYFGRRRGVTIYTWTGDRYAQYGAKVIPSTERDATYVLDEILDNETGLEILEHTVDTHGYTDLIFALFDLLGMRFAPRIRDVADARLWGLQGMDPVIAKRLRVASTIRRKKIVGSWDEMLRVAGSLKGQWVTASTLVAKLQAQPKRGLAGALVEYGRVCKTEHVLRYFASEDYRRRIGRQLNKGEEVHALREYLIFGNRAAFTKKDAAGLLNQAACINLLSNAVVVWNTVYMHRVLDQLRAEGFLVRDEDIARLSPCRFEHVNKIGRYYFDALPSEGDFRPTERRYR